MKLLASSFILFFAASFTAAAPYQHPHHPPYTNSSTSPLDTPTAIVIQESIQTTITFPSWTWYPSFYTTIYVDPTSISLLTTVVNPQPTSANTTLITVWASGQGTSAPKQTLTNPTVSTLFEPASESTSSSSMSTVTVSEMVTVTAAASSIVAATGRGRLDRAGFNVASGVG